MNSITPILIIYGATGTGKTAFAEVIAQKIDGAIINMDMGQLYTRLSVGTAKPDWKKSCTPQYLFDVIDKKKDFSAIEYRKKVEKLIKELTKKEKKIIIVGGTGFYLYNLIFSNKSIKRKSGSKKKWQKIECLWSHLKEIDPKRASEIHRNDIYRIKRALEIYYDTGNCPSEYAPKFDPVHHNIVLINLDRDTQELQQRVEQRIERFFIDGWIQEVDTLMQDGWSDFILKKKFIGYPSLIKMLQEKNNNIQDIKKEITQKTMQYVKKQKSFWRGLYKKIKQNSIETKTITLVDFNLTFAQLDLYLDLFLKKFFPHE